MRDAAGGGGWCFVCVIQLRLGRLHAFGERLAAASLSSANRKACSGQKGMLG
jgi:hypothetical protein